VEKLDGPLVLNLGTGGIRTIKELSELIREVLVLRVSCATIPPTQKALLGRCVIAQRLRVVGLWRDDTFMKTLCALPGDPERLQRADADLLMFSVVIPVYKNQETLEMLMLELERVREQLSSPMECVFVVDGSPDSSYEKLKELLPRYGGPSQLLSLSRNFGSFSAIRAGLRAARGKYLAVCAADLQEPPELLISFFKELRAGKAEVVVGRRVSRSDGFTNDLASRLFWASYRILVNSEVPVGGVDVFGCSSRVRDYLVALEESCSSLVGLLYWLGFERAEIPYERRPRPVGKSAWSFRKKCRYLSDSVFSFTDLPIRLLLVAGITGIGLSLFLVPVVLASKMLGVIQVPGYTPIAIGLLFFGGLNCFGLGIIGAYVWRCYENTKRRALYVVDAIHTFNVGQESDDECVYS
jgi:glycosyltransferase involved in cell wall biosynthesis